MVGVIMSHKLMRSCLPHRMVPGGKENISPYHCKVIIMQHDPLLTLTGCCNDNRKDQEDDTGDENGRVLQINGHDTQVLQFIIVVLIDCDDEKFPEP